MGVKFGMEEGTLGPLVHAKFHPHRCNVSPLRGEKPQNWPLSKLNTGRFALRAMLPVTNCRINTWTDCSSNCQIHLKPCKGAITLVGKLPVIRGKTAWNWQRAVLSADAGLLVKICEWIDWQTDRHPHNVTTLSHYNSKMYMNQFWQFLAQLLLRK